MSWGCWPELPFDPEYHRCQPRSSELPAGCLPDVSQINRLFQNSTEKTSSSSPVNALNSLPASFPPGLPLPDLADELIIYQLFCLCLCNCPPCARRLPPFQVSSGPACSLLSHGKSQPCPAPCSSPRGPMTLLLLETSSMATVLLQQSS